MAGGVSEEIRLFGGVFGGFRVYVEGLGCSGCFQSNFAGGG